MLHQILNGIHLSGRGNKKSAIRNRNHLTAAQMDKLPRLKKILERMEDPQNFAGERRNAAQLLQSIGGFKGKAVTGIFKCIEGFNVLDAPSNLTLFLTS